MTGQKPRVLFLSTGNATRGLIAEGFLRTLTGDRFDVASAGVEPSALNPLASEVMQEAGIDISGQEPQRVAQSGKNISVTVSPSVIWPRKEVRYSSSHSTSNIGVSSTQMLRPDCPSREQRLFAACETRFGTRLGNS
jgi:hypothetical protein